MTEDAKRLRIGEVAELVGTTPRTIRYYEELGLLPASESREPGAHRLYEQRDVERLRDVMRLKETLGLSLEDLRELAAAEVGRAELRDEWHGGIDDPIRRRQILEEALVLLDRQLELVRRRRVEIDGLADDLAERRRRVTGHLRELGTESTQAGGSR
jgi:DNA-binding transcriptional MerR regulator